MLSTYLDPVEHLQFFSGSHRTRTISNDCDIEEQLNMSVKRYNSLYQMLQKTSVNSMINAKGTRVNYYLKRLNFIFILFTVFFQDVRDHASPHLSVFFNHVTLDYFSSLFLAFIKTSRYLVVSLYFLCLQVSVHSSTYSILIMPL